MIKFINNRLVAKTLEGLEGVLNQELQRLGARNTKIVKRAVMFDGDLQLMYKINYLSRISLRILKTLAEYDASDEEKLYYGASQIPWEEYFTPDETIAVNGVINDSNLTHSKYIALKTKDAIVDRFRDKFGRRPDVDTREANVVINIRIFQNVATISLDSSGAPLYRRGYRKTIGIAPINEVLAAGMVQLSNWDRKEALLDPMCGAGTIPIEAALYALKIPAGYFRETYAFQNWRNFDKKLWTEIIENYKPDMERKIPAIYAWDKSGIAISKTRENIAFAGLSDFISTKTISFEEADAPEEKGKIIANPPYGERISLNQPKEFYQMIGDTLKRKYTNWQAWVISSDLTSLKFVGLRPTKKIFMLNAQLDSMFVRYDLYEGSKKAKFAKDYEKKKARQAKRDKYKDEKRGQSDGKDYRKR